MDRPSVQKQRRQRALLFLMRRLTLLPLVLLFVMHGLDVVRIPYLDRLDAWIYDAKLVANAPKTLHPEVVIVDIDEASLSTFGRWPWTRHTTAALVEQLGTHQQVAAIGFDMVFAESENAAADSALAHAVAHQPVVLGYYLTSDRSGHTTGVLPSPVFVQGGERGRDFQITQWSGFGANLPMLTQKAMQAGFFNAISDMDGVIRSAPLLAEFQGKYYESLALALYRRYLAYRSVTKALPVVSPHFASDDHGYRHLDALELRQEAFLKTITVNDAVVKLVPYRGHGGPDGGSFRYVSAADVLLGKLPAASLRGKVVLIGSSAPTLEDLRVTPFDRAYPGVEVQANLIAGLIDGAALHKPDYAVGLDALQLLIVGATLPFLLPSLSALAAVALTAGLAIALWLAHHLLFTQSALVLPCAASLILILSIFILHVSQGYFIEGRRRKRLKQLFGNYVSPKWVSRMVRSTDNYSMQATNQTLTVMFCDMRGFTRLSETLPPLALQGLLNDIFTRLSLTIQRHGGTIDKYMGDCVMAFWGAPEPQSDHAIRAIRCALDLQRDIAAFNQERGHDTPEIKMGTGINTGLMCVGDMGSSVRRSYTVIGEAVNLAARLESLCKTYNQTLIVSGSTKEAANFNQPHLHWQDLGQATVAGSGHPVHIFTLQHEMKTT